MSEISLLTKEELLNIFLSTDGSKDDSSEVYRNISNLYKDIDCSSGSQNLILDSFSKESSYSPQSQKSIPYNLRIVTEDDLEGFDNPQKNSFKNQSFLSMQSETIRPNLTLTDIYQELCRLPKDKHNSEHASPKTIVSLSGQSEAKSEVNYQKENFSIGSLKLQEEPETAEEGCNKRYRPNTTIKNSLLTIASQQKRRPVINSSQNACANCAIF